MRGGEERGGARLAVSSLERCLAHCVVFNSHLSGRWPSERSLPLP